jgi:hypothetical protein
LDFLLRCGGDHARCEKVEHTQGVVGPEATPGVTAWTVC